MPFYLTKTASKIYVVTPAGAATEVTLPSGNSILAGRRMRAAVLDRNVVAVNGTTKALWIDPTGVAAVARDMAIPTPHAAPTVAAGAAGTLSGTFNCQVAFLVKDASGDVIAHGPYGPLSDDVTVASQKIALTDIPISTHAAVNARRVSRSTTGPGSVQFEWFDIDDNTTSSFSDDLADEALSLLPVQDELGQPPSDLELIVEWKRRLWAKSRNDIDNLYYTGDGLFYGWAAANVVPIPPFGNDTTGINGFIRRRDELAVGRIDRIWKIIGDDPENFARVILVEGTGFAAPDANVTIRDIGYFLSNDGVYRWGPDGVASVSKEKVHGWFSTDDYFNRSEYDQAVGWWDPRFDTYNLLLCAAGTSVLNRWVAYDIPKNRWFGPHKTDAFTPAFAALLQDANALPMATLAGTNGFLYKMNQATAADDGTAIDLDLTLRHNGRTPDIDKVFLQMSVLTKIESAGTLTITPALGGLNASDQSAISHDLTLGRQRLRHISTEAQAVGRILKLRLRNAELNQAVHIYGYEIPFHESGRR